MDAYIPLRSTANASVKVTPVKFREIQLFTITYVVELISYLSLTDIEISRMMHIGFFFFFQCLRELVRMIDTDR